MALIASSAAATAAASTASLLLLAAATVFITEAETDVKIVEVNVEACVQILVAICLATTSAGAECFDFLR